MEVNHIKHLTLPFHHLSLSFPLSANSPFILLSLDFKVHFLKKRFTFKKRKIQWNFLKAESSFVSLSWMRRVCYRITYSHGVQEREASKVSLFACIFSLLWFPFAFFWWFVWRVCWGFLPMRNGGVHDHCSKETKHTDTIFNVVRQIAYIHGRDQYY